MASWTRCFLKWCVDGQAARLRRTAAKRLMCGGRNAAPYLGFVGVNLVTGYGLITKQDEMDKICEDIRLCLGAPYWENHIIEGGVKSINLEDLELGQIIDKGCNAIVHAAKLKIPQEDYLQMQFGSCDEQAIPEDENSNEESPMSVIQQASTSGEIVIAEDRITNKDDKTPQRPETANQNLSADSNILRLNPKFEGFNLAVKMMFNYDAESNASSIYNSMYREIIPAKLVAIDERMDMWEKSNRSKKKSLPPHPNIVDLQYVFVDSVPLLSSAMDLYPDALPRRLNFEGSGRNMTLFLVMKRYHCSLEQYLHYYTPSLTTRILLLTQLLEGVVHLVNNSVAHRDLKPDNILLDLREGLDVPQLVITDFGCCLADEKFGLKLPYFTELIQRGGNSALMAPEVATISPGLFSIIDYNQADLWSVGALAYFILGFPIPFYQTSGRSLDSRTYREEQLPEFSNDIPKPITKLIFKILQRNPRKRPLPSVAANICQLQLWGPPRLTDCPREITTVQEVLNWLVSEAAISLCQASTNNRSLLLQLRNVFLGRVKIVEVMEALEYFK